MIIGDWMDEKKEVLIRSYKENGKYYGKILWVENLQNRGKPLPAHEQHWINMIIMKDFVFDKDEWNSGKIYVPKSDKTYTAYVKAISSNVLKVTGFIWFRFLSESQIFIRVAQKKKN
ncbi:MAG: DUF2147 domain-containing protein [Bacteroidota bacterium]|nr:DUF2147 domain-containing protein [Bacteroidota bacterium]